MLNVNPDNTASMASLVESVKKPFPNLLSEFVYVRTYSRWVEEDGRRESWGETVDRYFRFIAEERPNVPEHVLAAAREYVLRMEVLPSMRALWAAGEAARRDNTTLYNCFGGDVRFVTSEGVPTLREAVGRNVTVRVADGSWQSASVHHFGRQMLFDVTLRHWTGRKHGNESQVIRVTEDHRWLLLDGSETTHLRVGDKLAAPDLSISEEDVDAEAVRHGFVFGDGTLNHEGAVAYPQVRLCGKKAQHLDTLFKGFKRSFPPSYGGDPMVYCGRENAHWKELPASANPGYIAGFIRGLFLADGCGVSTSGNLRFSSQDAALVAWMRENAPVAGYKFLTDQSYNEPTAFGERSAPLHMFLLGTGNAAVFRVESIVAVGVDDVFCVVEPVTRTFTLACGQVTGNCSFCPLDSLPSFSELLYILMQGTGVGFSVERKFVGNLPVVGDLTGVTVDFKIVDSTTGWADALFFGLTNWFRGNRVVFDYSAIRLRGAPLKTKGGRASGPEPLKRLLDLCEETILGASGRQLRSIECHDIACTVGDIVHVGGFRRAALISFSDPDDEEMRHAKDWSRGKFPEVRYMANNSAFWASKPDEGTFWNEWRALVASNSGERGFYMMPPAKRQVRRGDFRSNPCITADAWVQTTRGAQQVSALIGQPFEAVVDGRVYDAPKGFWSTGIKSVFRLETAEGYTLDLTANHQVYRITQTARQQRGEWVSVSQVCPGDLLRLNNHRDVEVETDGQAHASGWLLGSLLGDGNFSRTEGKSDLGQVKFWGADGQFMADHAMQCVRTAGLKVRSDVAPLLHKTNGYWVVSCVALADMAQSHGMDSPDGKVISAQIEGASETFIAGFLRGLFDADGSVQGTQDKGVSVRLSQSNLSVLQAAQRMLLRLGVVSSIYKNRREAGYRNLPNGKGSLAPYWCEAQHELVVANDNMFRFETVVGFMEPAKKALLTDLLGRYHRAPNRERFVASMTTLTPIGDMQVFDTSIPGLAAFDANGFYVHNCGEILLRFAQSVDPWTGEGGGGEFCNLTGAVMRAEDTLKSFAEKVRWATWIGVVQSSFTHFPYLRPAWAKHCEEDRLLGVDITGQCDNPALSGDDGAMLYFNEVARQTAAEASAYMGINYPAAITCGKPSGNSSQLVDCASGFHPRYAQYYMRRVRIDGKDPLTALMRDSGMTLYRENGQEEVPEDQVSVWVVEFPVAAPNNARLRDHETAIEMLERYLQIMRTWCGERGHNQSATIYVRDHEWDEVGRWVFAHFDEITGLAFLPHSNHAYKLAPYEEITREQYEAAMAEMPSIDFSILSAYELEDRGQGSTELACMGGACDAV